MVIRCCIISNQHFWTAWWYGQLVFPSIIPKTKRKRKEKKKIRKYLYTISLKQLSRLISLQKSPEVIPLYSHLKPALHLCTLYLKPVASRLQGESFGGLVLTTRFTLMIRVSNSSKFSWLFSVLSLTLGLYRASKQTKDKSILKECVFYWCKLDNKEVAKA